MALSYTSRMLLIRATATTRITTSHFLFMTSSLQQLETPLLIIAPSSSSSSSPSSSFRWLSTSSSSSEEKSSSGGGGGITGWIRDKWDNRTKQEQDKKFLQQMEKMSSAEKWTLADFQAELNDSLGGWRNKIPGMSGMKQIKVAKQTQQVIQAVVEQVSGGPQATADDLKNLTRKEKLKISLKSGTSVEELNVLIQQFTGIHIMQQVIRRRKLEGLPMPTDEATMRAIMQTDIPKVISKQDRKNAMKAQLRKQPKRF